MQYGKLFPDINLCELNKLGKLKYTPLVLPAIVILYKVYKNRYVIKGNISALLHKLIDYLTENVNVLSGFEKVSVCICVYMLISLVYNH